MDIEDNDKPSKSDYERRAEAKRKAIEGDEDPNENIEVDEVGSRDGPSGEQIDRCQLHPDHGVVASCPDIFNANNSGMPSTRNPNRAGGGRMLTPSDYQVFRVPEVPRQRRPRSSSGQSNRNIASPHGSSPIRTSPRKVSGGSSPTTNWGISSGSTSSTDRPGTSVANSSESDNKDHGAVKVFDVSELPGRSLQSILERELAKTRHTNDGNDGSGNTTPRIVLPCCKAPTAIDFSEGLSATLIEVARRNPAPTPVHPIPEIVNIVGGSGNAGASGHPNNPSIIGSHSIAEISIMNPGDGGVSGFPVKNPPSARHYRIGDTGMTEYGDPRADFFLSSNPLTASVSLTELTRTTGQGNTSAELHQINNPPPTSYGSPNLFPINNPATIGHSRSAPENLGGLRDGDPGDPLYYPNPNQERPELPYNVDEQGDTMASNLLPLDMTVTGHSCVETTSSSKPSSVGPSSKAVPSSSRQGKDNDSKITLADYDLTHTSSDSE